MQEKLKLNKSKAFTLIEVVVAIAILAIGLVGAYGVLPLIIKSQAINIDEFLASQIANEGVELTRNLRDNNWLLWLSDWKTGLKGCSLGCEIDYNDTGFTVIGESGRFLQIDPTNGFYNYGLGTDSKFKRKITIIEDASGYLNTKVEVTWNGNGSPFILEENFYDWQ